MSDNPSVTVLMSVYNAEKYLRQAIESILQQSYQDFEFLILNDKSTDNSEEIIGQYDDSRIRLVNNAQNIGLTKSLNKGIDLSKGKYIARMDADDISLPSRLEEQVAFMEAEPDVVAAGSWINIIDGKQIKLNEWHYPCYHDELVTYLLFDSCIVHPSAIIRRSIINKYNIRYDEELETAQDYQFWYECSRFAKLANIPKVLLKYRKHDGQISVSSKSQRNNATQTKLSILNEMGLKNDRLMEYHKKFSHSGSVKTIREFAQYFYWLIGLLWTVNKQDNLKLISTLKVIAKRNRM